jgi:hypothetical protein
MRTQTLLVLGLVVAASVGAPGQEHRPSAAPATWKFGAAPAERAVPTGHDDTGSQSAHPRPHKAVARAVHAATGAPRRVALRWPAGRDAQAWLVLKWPAAAPAAVTLQWPVATERP